MRHLLRPEGMPLANGYSRAVAVRRGSSVR